MATAVVERTWRESTPEGVEQDLAALWRDLASGESPVTRAVMANLVVFRLPERARADEPSARSGDAVLESVVALHPSRTLVIEHDRGEPDPQAPFAAGVGVSVFGTAAGRYGVERILVRAACADESLPSIIRRFVHGGRPTSLWWTEDLSKSAPSDCLIELARQLIYDSRQWSDVRGGLRAIAALAKARHVDLADLNWRRLAPIRRALVHAAAGLGTDRSSLTMTVAHAPGEAALGWLLAGWIAARLRLAPHQWPAFEATADDGELVTFTIHDGASSLTTALDRHRVLVSQTGVAPISVPAAEEPIADAVAAEMRSLSRDAVLTDTIAALVGPLADRR